MKPTTDTPRTDACPHCGAEFAPRQLNCYCGTANPYYPVTAHQSELCTERAKSQKLEAEIQKLRANLTRAMEIAEEFSLGGVFALDAITASGRWAFEPQNDPRRIIKSANDKLNQLKATLNPTDK